MNAASKLKTIASEKLTGVVYATSYLSDARTTICVYGDPGQNHEVAYGFWVGLQPR
jgi:hypothetical protein